MGRDETTLCELATPGQTSIEFVRAREATSVSAYAQANVGPAVCLLSLAAAATWVTTFASHLVWESEDRSAQMSFELFPAQTRLEFLEHAGRPYRLREPLLVEIRRDGSFVSVLSRELGLFGSGTSEAEAIREFGDRVVVTWQELSRTPMTRMHASAIAQAAELNWLFSREND